MNVIRFLLRGLRPAVPLLLAVLISCSVMVGPAFAIRGRAEAEPPPTKSYVLPYTIVILSIAMGLAILCRPGRRMDEPHQKAKED